MMEEEQGSKLVIPELIVGLGNPEPKYDRTRHNVGFAAVDALADYWQVSKTANRKFQGEFGEGIGSKSKKIRLLKPQTYMNNSGRSIRAVLDWYKLPPQSVLIVYDDMDLPLGRLRLRLSGSAGGHNGMKSAIAHLGTQEFPRLRIGIGRPKNAVADTNDKKTIGYVLGKFSPEETELIDGVIKLVVEAIDLSLRQGVEKAMSLYNRQEAKGKRQE